MAADQSPRDQVRGRLIRRSGGTHPPQSSPGGRGDFSTFAQREVRKMTITKTDSRGPAPTWPRANNFDITDAEMEAFEAMIPGLFESTTTRLCPVAGREAHSHTLHSTATQGSRPEPGGRPLQRHPAALHPEGGDRRKAGGKANRVEEQHLRVAGIPHDLRVAHPGTLHPRQRRHHRGPYAGRGRPRSTPS